MKIFPRLVAEFIATFALVFIGAGAVCANALSNGSPDLTGIAFAHGLAIMVMVYAIGHVSGGHINPAVTFAMWITKQMRGDVAGYYIVSQLFGCVLAALCLKGLYPQYVTAAPFLGNPELNHAIPHMSMVMGIAVEAILTFFLVFVIFGVAVDGRGQKSAVGLAIGLTVTLDILMGGIFTGGAMNPARAFGTAVVTGRWADHAVYWVGPLLGGLLASKTYMRFCYGR